MATKHLTDQEKASMKAAASKAAEFRKSSDVLAVVAEFKPRFEEISKIVSEAWREVGQLTAELLEACSLDDTKDGRKQYNALIRLMTLEPYVAQVSGQWASVIMVEDVHFDEPGANNSVTRIDIKTMRDARDLKKLSKVANEALGISRKRAKKTPTAQAPADQASIWPLLRQVVDSEAGRAELRRYLNSWGYEFTAIATSTAEIPAQRKLRKVA